MAETEIQVQVRFKVETIHGRYQDALYFTPAAFAAMKESDIEAAINERTDSWVAVIEAPPTEPTLEELEAQKAVAEQVRADLEALKASGIDQQIAEKQAEIAALDAEIAKKG